MYGPTTKNSETQKEFLRKVGIEEPIFILRARDALAVSTIKEWIENAKFHQVNEEKLKQARSHLDEFLAWQRFNKTKLPD